MFRSKNRYVYTCPDVINYRKNQYRLFGWSTAINYLMLLGFFGGMAYVSKKNEPITEQTLPVTNV